MSKLAAMLAIGLSLAPVALAGSRNWQDATIISMGTGEGPTVAAPVGGMWVLAPWASRRRQDLLDLLDQLTPKIQELSRALEEEVEKREVARRLMTYPGVGPPTALAFELVIGTPARFRCGKQIASYVGLVPAEDSSGDRRHGTEKSWSIE